MTKPLMTLEDYLASLERLKARANTEALMADDTIDGRAARIVERIFELEICELRMNQNHE